MMVVGAALLGSGCFGGFLAGLLAGTVGRGFDPTFADMVDAVVAPTNAGLIVEAPETVRVGAPFDLRIVVENHGPEERMIATVDLNGAICDQFEVIGVDPSPAGRAIEYGWHEYTYESSLPAESSRTFVITMQATAAGVHEGDVNVYIGETYQSISDSLTITAEPPR
jgi:hypothetical protein